ncbi:MAG: amino acid dehydrogenase [Legionellales bacterium]|nr:amino acid dehydrogenase [Legionellales bacterium]|tara:strand:- start:1141 stop:2235 length:1095 start_codon:yes stop_codon:yes gene_type:complete
MFSPSGGKVNTSLTEISDMFNALEALEFGDLHFKYDPDTQLKAIIAIHDTSLGPALGGCRFIEYPNSDSAIIDAMRLARGMSYKAAISDLDHGGGKSVIIQPPEIKDRRALFEAFGRFVEELGGRYITAKDSGTTLEDMDIIATQTQYVASTSDMKQPNSDPSPYTSLGVLRGIEAAVKFKLGRDNLEGVHVAIQGVGHVGHHLAQELHMKGAKLTVCDTVEEHVQRCVDDFVATPVNNEEIFAVDCDVFAPCALGAIINDKTIAQLKADIVCGSSNNQLAEQRHGRELQEKGILYAPDYLVNSGGLIHAVGRYDGIPDEVSDQKILNIYDGCLEIFERAKTAGEATCDIIDTIAKERLYRKNA